MIGLQLPLPEPTPCAAAMSEAPSGASERVAAWTALPGGVVDDNEVVLLAIKPSTWRPLFDSATWLGFCCFLTGLLIGLESPFPGLSLMETAQLMLLVGLARLALAIVRWVLMWYVLTNRRVLSVQGIREPRICACMLLDVRNTYLNRSLPERLVGLGSITFVSSDPTDPPSMWQTVAKPELVHERIRRAIENAIDQHDL